MINHLTSIALLIFFTWVIKEVYKNSKITNPDEREWFAN